jgi:PAS domain S-box-containing protein
LTFALDGTVQTWSRGAEKLCGYAVAEMKGRPLALLLEAADRELYQHKRNSRARGASVT